VNQDPYEKWRKRAELEVKKEQDAKGPLGRGLARFRSWLYLTLGEMIRDEVTIRAESLSYLTLFSILPICAGAFLLAGVLSKFAAFEDHMIDWIADALTPVPPEHRDFLIDFILSFQEQYIATVEKKGLLIAVLAIAGLLWVCWKMLFNVERVLDRIWESRMKRTTMLRVKTFAIWITLIPGLFFGVMMFAASFAHFQWVSHVGVFLLAFSIYKFLPSTMVHSRSALISAGFLTFFELITSKFMVFYFSVATNSAYGKASAIPLVAFWIYILWVCFLIAAELGCISQERQESHI
jgi:membrane protein